MRSLLRAYDRLLDLCGLVACTVLGGVVFAVALDVILRVARLARGIPGIVEITEYGLLVATFAGAAWALRAGSHIAVEIVVDMLPAGSRAVVDRIASALGLTVCVMLVYAGTRAALRSHELGTLVFKTFVFPEWWILVALPSAAALMAVEFLLRLTGVRSVRPVTGQ